MGVTDLCKFRSPLGDRIREQIDSSEYINPWLVGYWLHKDYEGRGYMTEAVAAMLEFGVKHLGIDCYLATINPENHKSVNLVKRLGFEFLTNGTLANKTRGVWPETIPCVVYKKLYHE